MSGSHENLSAGIFQPNNIIPELSQYTTAAGIMPAKRSILETVVRTRREDPSFFFNKKGRDLLATANKTIYTALEGFYNHDNPQVLYTEQMKKVNAHIETMISKFCPPDKLSFLRLSPEVSFPPQPAQLIGLIHSPDQDPRLQYELARQATLALISAELDANAGEVRDRLSEVHYHLNYDLFGPHPKRDNNTIYALHDNEANKVKWIDTVNEDVNSEILYNTHLKAHYSQTRLVDGIGFIFFESRTKGVGGVIKAVRKAMLRGEKGEEDTIQVKEDVPDIMGIKFVVTEAFSSDDPKVSDLIVRVKESLMDHFNLTNEHFKFKNTRTGSRFQGGFQGKRLMVTFPDMSVPLEIMFHGEGDHLNNEFNIGDVDPITGKRNSQAHAMMEIERDITVLDRLFPKSIYGDIDWDAICERKHTDVAKQLRYSNIVPPRRMGVSIATNSEGKHRIILNPK